MRFRARSDPRLRRLHKTWSFRLFCLSILSIPLQGLYLGGIATTPVKVTFLLTISTFVIELLLGRIKLLPVRFPHILLALFAFWSLVTVLWAPVFDRAMIFTASTLSLFIVFYLSSLFAHDEACVRRILYWAVAGITISGILAHLQFGGFIAIPGKAIEEAALRGEKLRAPGGTEGANVLALYLSTVLSILYCRIVLFRYSRLHIVILLAFIYLLYLLLITYTRAGYLGLMVSLAFVTVLSVRKRAMPFLVLLVLAFFLLSTNYVFVRIESLFDPGSDYSASSRLVFARAALNMFADHPFGIGLGNFLPNSLPYIGVTESNPRAAHNAFLNILAELGVPGILLYLTFLTVTAYYIYAIHSSNKRKSIMLAAPFVTLISQYPFHGYMYDKTFFLLAGVVFTMYTTSRRSRAPAAAAEGRKSLKPGA